MNRTLSDVLKKYQRGFSPVINFEEKKLKKLDFTENNTELAKISIEDTEALNRFIQESLALSGADIGYGGYAEDRMIYKRSSHFGNNQDARSIHLGTDVWGPARTPIHTPLDARVHSFQINDNFGDYGPTIILEHEIDRFRFYTLYGHLSEDSLEGKKEGQIIKQGSEFAYTGAAHENGKWPPHLHFQVIADMRGHKGDFPGVCRKRERKEYLMLCPDPKIILSI